MTHERYLFISYFGVGLFCLALGVLLYWKLRISFCRLTDPVSQQSIRSILRNVFRTGFLLPLAAFLSVSYRGGCSHPSYEAITSDLGLLVRTNQEQLSSAFLSVVLLLTFWCFILLAILWIMKRDAAGMTEAPAPASQPADPTVLPVPAAKERTQSHAPGWRLGLGILALWLLAVWGAYGLGFQHSATRGSSPLPLLGGRISPAQPAPATARTSASKVLTVNRKFNFAVINMGLQDGIKMGDKMKVSRGGKDIATIQAEKLYDKFSAATLIEEDPKRPVVEGDEIRKA